MTHGVAPRGANGFAASAQLYANRAPFFPIMDHPSLLETFTRVYGRPATVVARAPGRIEFVGNHTDYNGGEVLGAAIDRFVWVAAVENDTGRCRFHTVGGENVVEWSPEITARPAGDEAWINYPLGVWHSLADFGLARPAGFDVVVAADLPAGAGLSSSAALELATALALLALARTPIPGKDVLAKIARHAENRYVGVPCGILDQGTSAHGEAGRLVRIDCRGPRFSLVPLPAGLTLWVFNTREKHALVDGMYATRHRECLEAARLLGVELLCDLQPGPALDARLAALPENLRRRARHVIEEHDRVGRVVAALQRGEIRTVGELLFASHASSRDLFENSTPALDTLVELLRTQRGVIGARLTGGGFGGAVMALTDDSFTPADAAIVQRAYATRHNREPEVIKLAVADGARLL